jgi:hypothetical protein
MMPPPPTQVSSERLPFTALCHGGADEERSRTGSEEAELEALKRFHVVGGDLFLRVVWRFAVEHKVNTHNSLAAKAKQRRSTGERTLGGEGVHGRKRGPLPLKFLA